MIPKTPEINRYESPPASPMYQVKYKDYETCIEVIKQLETELNEFQTSSYELEKELELELNLLETENEKFQKENKELTFEVNNLKQGKKNSEDLLNITKNELNSKIEKLESTITEKTTKLINVEIENDNITERERELRDEIIDLNLNLSIQTEKAILLENEIEQLKNNLILVELKNQNLNNQVKHLNEEISDLKVHKNLPKQSQTTSLANSSPLLSTTSSTHQQSSPYTKSKKLNRSNSIIQLHSMIQQTKKMGYKIDNIKSSLNSKSKTTTKISNTNIMTTSSYIPKKIPSSPSSLKLSSKLNKNFEKMDKINGSPNDKNIYNLQKKPV
ncbi:hypothetical protein WICMUC_003665 [Wickerhamomyces mucosus]|uniref:NUDE domain-containing protein n=1 Tax=Wickerhamomyces mucosus TaxID=1378264 RepID=A0A9P8PJQ9_9ASCO|nr:hypothetical protein WICMUC_003665 [Wickerhamomyces mucosus]